MLPLAFGIGAGSQMLQPLAISVIGGLLARWSFPYLYPGHQLLSETRFRCLTDKR